MSFVRVGADVRSERLPARKPRVGRIANRWRGREAQQGKSWSSRRCRAGLHHDGPHPSSHEQGEDVQAGQVRLSGLLRGRRQTITDRASRHTAAQHSHGTPTCRPRPTSESCLEVQGEPLLGPPTDETTDMRDHGHVRRQGLSSGHREAPRGPERRATTSSTHARMNVTG